MITRLRVLSVGLLFFAAVSEAPAATIVTPPDGTQGHPFMPSIQSGGTSTFTISYSGSGVVYFDPPSSSAIFTLTTPGLDFSELVVPTQASVGSSSLTVTPLDPAAPPESLTVGTGTPLTFTPPVHSFSLSGDFDPTLPGFEFGLAFTGGGTVAFDYTPQAVPEPASLTLMALGGVGLAGYALRRRKKAVSA